MFCSCSAQPAGDAPPHDPVVGTAGRLAAAELVVACARFAAGRAASSTVVRRGTCPANRRSRAADRSRSGCTIGSGGRAIDGADRPTSARNSHMRRHSPVGHFSRPACRPLSSSLRQILRRDETRPRRLSTYIARAPVCPPPAPSPRARRPETHVASWRVLSASGQTFDRPCVSRPSPSFPTHSLRCRGR